MSNDFGRPLTTESFQALLTLIQWAWSTFKASVAEVVDAPANQDIYPSPTGNADKEIPNVSMKPVAKTQRLAECVCEVRTQLVSMLSDPLPMLGSVRKFGQPTKLRHQALEMADSLLQDAHITYVSCFHAFYPTGHLKWVCLCSLGPSW